MGDSKKLLMSYFMKTSDVLNLNLKALVIIKNFYIEILNTIFALCTITIIN